MLEDIKNTGKRVVGTKQLLRAIEAGKVARVFLAKDADEFVYRRIASAAENAGVTIERVEHMTDLGKACGVEVKTAGAGILKV